MLILIISTLLVLYLVNNFYWKRRNLPPGPPPLPLIGNLLAIAFNAPGYEPFRKWRKQYGPIYTVWLGPKPKVIIADYQLMKDTIQADPLSYVDRPIFPMVWETRGGNYGMIFSSGDVWQQHRRFALHVLRDFGLGKNIMEQRVLAEVEPFLLSLTEQCKSGAFDFKDLLNFAVGSVINNIVFGFRFDETHIGSFKRLKYLTDRQMNESAQIPAQIVQFNMWLKNVWPFSKFYQMVMNTSEELFGFFRSQIEDHRKEIDFDSEEAKDFVEAYLKEQWKHREEEDCGGFSNKQLENVCLDLWATGLETTATTLYWAFLYMHNNPDVLQKLTEELDNLVGPQIITMNDKPRLHYMNAFIQEVQRCCNLFPMNLFRLTSNDVTINDHFLPKGTSIIPQLSTVMLDDKVFPDPYAFDPERHLKDGEFVKIDEMIPFSMGKRQCLGESLARMELFLFISNFCNKFKIEIGEKLPEQKKFGITVKPPNYSLKIEERY